MRRPPQPDERRAKPLDVMPVCAVCQRDGAAVDLEAYVPAGDGGQSDATLCDLVFGSRQQNGEAALMRQNGEAALMRHGRHGDHRAQRSCRPPVTVRRSIRPVLTKYGQPAHNALPVDAPPDGSTIRQQWVRGAIRLRVARAQVAAGAGGIANAPMTISRLRV